jgi:hypothetical protein
MYVLYRFGKWLGVFSKCLEKYEESSSDYNRRLLEGVETIANNTSIPDESVSRLDSLRKSNHELVERQKIRKMIEEELDIEM